jgi:hypothetical protein
MTPARERGVGSRSTLSSTSRSAFFFSLFLLSRPLYPPFPTRGDKTSLLLRAPRERRGDEGADEKNKKKEKALGAASLFRGTSDDKWRGGSVAGSGHAPRSGFPVWSEDDGGGGGGGDYRVSPRLGDPRREGGTDGRPAREPGTARPGASDEGPGARPVRSPNLRGEGERERAGTARSPVTGSAGTPELGSSGAIVSRCGPGASAGILRARAREASGRGGARRLRRDAGRLRSRADDGHQALRSGSPRTEWRGDRCPGSASLSPQASIRRPVQAGQLHLPPGSATGTCLRKCNDEDACTDDSCDPQTGACLKVSPIPACPGSCGGDDANGDDSDP